MEGQEEMSCIKNEPEDDLAQLSNDPSEADLKNLSNESTKIEPKDIKTNDPIKKTKKTRRLKRIGERKSLRISSTFTETSSKKNKNSEIIKELTLILKKDSDSLTQEDQNILTKYPTLISEAKQRLDKRTLASERLKEFEDPREVLDSKCLQLADIIRKSRHLIIYTGAGLSTEANIPDYRGENGVWTLLRKGQSLSEPLKDFTLADPTLSHMAIQKLYSMKILKHVVSQNCDCLHLRSGLPKISLSEIHGNSHIEVCRNEKCSREYVRLFDVTERTRKHRHKTGRFCYYHAGNNELMDTIVHFSEKGKLRYPLNWAGAQYHAHKADTILCLGSSLKVLRSYHWLWCMDKPVKERPTLIICNLQWTAKDSHAALKIHGKCDYVMSKVMQILGIPIPVYSRSTDPIFALATPLHPSENDSKTCKDLTLPKDENEEGNEKLRREDDSATYSQTAPLDMTLKMENYIRFQPIFKWNKEEVDGGNKLAIKEKRQGSGRGGWFGVVAPFKPKKKKIK